MRVLDLHRSYYANVRDPADAVERAAVVREAIEAVDSLDDDGALLVLADRLQLAGSALGDLIAHQLAPNKVTRKRLVELERMARLTWLGPIAAIADGVEFRRGLPSRIVLARKPATLACDDMLWPMIDTLDLNGGLVHAELPRLLPRLARLRRLEGALPDVVANLRGAQRPPELVALGCHLGADRMRTGRYAAGTAHPDAVNPLVDDDRIRELRHGDPFQATAYRWLWRTPLGRQLERLSVANLTRDREVWSRLALPEWQRELADHAPATLREFELTEHDHGNFATGNGWTVRFTRGPSGAFDVVSASYKTGVDRGPEAPERFAGGLAELSPGSLHSLAIDWPDRILDGGWCLGLRREAERLGVWQR